MGLGGTPAPPRTGGGDISEELTAGGFSAEECPRAYYGLDPASGTVQLVTHAERSAHLHSHADVGSMPDDARRLKQVIRDLQFENDLLRSAIARAEKRDSLV